MDNQNSALDAELQSDLLDVLEDVPSWLLTSQRWRQVYELLGAITEALVGGDVDALLHAVGELELAGPVRITRIGATPADHAPDDVRERVNHLKHSLRPLGQSDDQISGESGGGGHHDDRRSDDRRPTS